MSARTEAPDFARDSAVEPLGTGRYRARCHEGWFVPRGPNGGYLAAIVLRALIAEAGPERPPRSLTLHYLRPPAAGEVEVGVRVRREGRRLTTLSATLEQDGRTCALALAALSADFPSAVDYAEAMPSVPPAEAVEAVPAPAGAPAFAHRLVTRPVAGARPFSGAAESAGGGWMALRDGPDEVDAPLLALLSDAWLPTPFARLRHPVAAPTVDLTLHLRAPGEPASAPVLGLFRSRFSHAGFFEEDGELWSADGRLLAQVRQLALLVP